MIREARTYASVHMPCRTSMVVANAEGDFRCGPALPLRLRGRLRQHLAPQIALLRIFGGGKNCRVNAIFPNGAACHAARIFDRSRSWRPPGVEAIDIFFGASHCVNIHCPQLRVVQRWAGEWILTKANVCVAVVTVTYWTADRAPI